MASINERLSILLEQELEDLPSVIRNAGDPVKDKLGSASSMAIGALRFVAVAQYVLNHDVAKFQTNLLDAAKYRLRLLERFEMGESISPSYVTMMNYKALFNALASCDLEIAKIIASHLGGRDEIEKEYDHPFDYAFGYTLRAFVLGDQEAMRRWATEFAVTCQAKENLDFQGYAQVFKGILEQDVGMIKNALQAIVKGHTKQSKGKGVFKDSEDEVLCVWGIGMVNLARAHGLSVEGEPPLIPKDLLC